MTISSLLNFERAIGGLIEVFGAPEGFTEEYHERLLKAEAVIQGELGKSFGQLSSNDLFEEKGVAAIKEVKKWVAETYKFPQQ